MIRTRFAAILAASAIAVGTLAAATPAHAATTSAFEGYNERFLDVGPVVYTMVVQAESSSTQKVNVGGVTKTVKHDWAISQMEAESKVGDSYDEDGNLIEVSYADMPTAHVGYWVARYAADQFSKAQDRFLDGTTAQIEAFYNSVVSTSPSTAAAYFKTSDAKAARIAAVKADVLRNGQKAFNYVSYRPGKHGPADYVHQHKAAIVKHLNKAFTKSKLYKGSVKVKFTRDFVVQMGPTKADRDRQLHYTVTVRDTTDKVAYAIELNTHDGGAYGYGVYKVKY